MTARKHPGPQGPRRPQLAIRVNIKGIEEIDKRAAASGVKRSEMARLMLAYASTHMPKK